MNAPKTSVRGGPHSSERHKIAGEGSRMPGTGKHARTVRTSMGRGNAVWSTPRTHGVLSECIISEDADADPETA